MRSTLTDPKVRVGAAGVTRAFGPVVANADVDLEVRRGTIHAVVGENGAGKTTLMRLLFGLDRPDSGTVVVDGRAVRLKGPADALARGIGIVQQESAVVPDLTMLENLVLGAEPRRRGLARGFVDWHAARARGAELALDTGVHLDWDAPASAVAAGVRQQLEVLRLLYRRADVLILDEPTAVLAPEQVGELLRLLRRLRSTGHTIVFISHKLDEVRAVADEITVLRGGRSVATVPAAEVDRAALAELVVGTDVPASVRAAADGPLTPERVPPQHPDAPVPDADLPGSDEPRTDVTDGDVPGAPGDPPALAVRDLRADDDRGTRRLDGCSFEVRPGEVVAVAGVGGNGQDELVECVVGLRRARSGRVHVNGTDVTRRGVAGRRAAGLAYVSADRVAEGAAVEQSITDNAVAGFHRRPLARLGWLGRGRTREFARGVLRSFSVRHGALGDPVRTLSGGNQQRLVVGRELAHEPAVLVAAQPTRGVDIKGIADLHARLARLRDTGTAVLLVSEELDEVLALADRVVVIAGGRVVKEVPGGTGRAAIGRLMLGSREGS
jgi:general nucleoside transport system ATP-binding protein